MNKVVVLVPVEWAEKVKACLEKQFPSSTVEKVESHVQKVFILNVTYSESNDDMMNYINDHLITAFDIFGWAM